MDRLERGCPNYEVSRWSLGARTHLDQDLSKRKPRETPKRFQNSLPGDRAWGLPAQISA